MSKIKSFSVDTGDMFYINHNSSNFTVIDCNLQDERKEEIMDEVCAEAKNKDITRFISTHPDEDHIHGIEYFDKRLPIINFYCVKNKVCKQDEEETDSFLKYCDLRDDTSKAYYIEKSCQRKWMNENGENDKGHYIGSAGINILWPDINNSKFQEALKKANETGHPNDISPIISYSVNEGVSVLWFGDLEHDFMESIQDDIKLPKSDIIFAPHHGRLSGAIPEKWLKQIDPKVIILGEAPSSLLKYFNNYNQITQNSAKDITIVCDGKKIHFYCGNENYTRNFLVNEGLDDSSLGYYLGTLTL